jgi:nicotinamidase-related amidase
MTITTLNARCALVLIDLQNGVVAAPTAPYTASEVVARAVDLAGAFRVVAGPVVLVRASLASDGADKTPGRTDTPPW